MTRIRYKVRTIAFLALCLLPGMVSACPTCKDSLHDNGAATGYAISILFMMSMPWLITAFWVVLIWRLRSRMVKSHVQSNAGIKLVNGKPKATASVMGRTPTPSASR